MSTTSIDTMLKIAAKSAKPAVPTTKPAAQSGPSDAADEFENYLRQAASSTAASEKPRTQEHPPASEKSSDKPVAASGQEQGATAFSEEESTHTPAVEEAQEITEDQPETIPTDEVILSVAASAIVPAAPAEVITDVAVMAKKSLVEPVLIAGQVVPAAAENPLPGNQPPPEVVTKPLVVEGLQMGEAAITTTGGDGHLVGDGLLVKEEAALSAVEATERIETDAEQTLAKPPAELGQVPATEQVISAQQVVSEEKTNTKKIEQGEQADAKSADAERAPVLETHLEIAQPVVTESAAETTGGEKTVEAKTTTTPDAPVPPVNSATNSQPAIQPIHNQPVNNDASATRGESESPAPTIDRARFVQRVANAFRSAQQSEGPIQMRLSPPELGALRIEIAVRNGVLSANLEAETADARRLLLDNLPALRQRLAEQDIRIDKFEVDIRRDGGQQEGQANARGQQSEQQQNRATAQNRIRTPQTAEVHAARVPRNHLTGTDAGLDVRI